ELRAEIERLRGNVRPRREDECLTLNHWRMRAYDLERNWARCSHACAVEQAKREQAEALAERLRAEVERLNRILGRIVEGDGDSTLVIRTGADAFAAAREYLLRDQEE